MKIMPGRQRTERIEFTRATQEQVPVFIGIMRMLHSEPLASSFARLLRRDLQSEDYVPLAHFFEEVSVLALHRHVPEDLLFDAFAFDQYWDELREDIARARGAAGNEKFGENFEIAAERARHYRRDFPPKLRWQRRDRPGDQPPPGGLDVGPRRRGPEPTPPAGTPDQRASLR
jgi:hypothetical protein